MCDATLICTFVNLRCVFVLYDLEGHSIAIVYLFCLKTFNSVVTWKIKTNINSFEQKKNRKGNKKIGVRYKRTEIIIIHV